MGVQWQAPWRFLPAIPNAAARPSLLHPCSRDFGYQICEIAFPDAYVMVLTDFDGGGLKTLGV